MFGNLPGGFDRWDLVDGRGYAVAHVAAMFGHLPEGFARWDLTSGDGLNVAEVKAAAEMMRKRLS
jgi:hypothetical protein